MAEEKLVVMLGGLHIELAALEAIGSLLLGSGWTDAVAQAGITTTGLAESLVTLAHHTHQVTASSLHILQQGLLVVFKMSSIPQMVQSSSQ